MDWLRLDSEEETFTLSPRFAWRLTCNVRNGNVKLGKCRVLGMSLLRYKGIEESALPDPSTQMNPDTSPSLLDQRDAALRIRTEKPAQTLTPEKGFFLPLITFGLCLSVFLVALDNTIIATAIPKITDEFQSLDDVGWYASA